ncbi:MAG: hypothetical protein KA714_19910 [Limnoraphis sp. WC205]|nr:hypothetical protein [Limnoraphis sp. WC205]
MGWGFVRPNSLWTCRWWGFIPHKEEGVRSQESEVRINGLGIRAPQFIMDVQTVGIYTR